MGPRSRSGVVTGCVSRAPCIHLGLLRPPVPGLTAMPGSKSWQTSDCCPKGKRYRQLATASLRCACILTPASLRRGCTVLHRLQRLQSAAAVRRHLSSRARLRSSTRCERNADSLRVQGARRRARRSRGQGHDVWSRCQSCRRLRAVRRSGDAQELPGRDSRALTAGHRVGPPAGRLQRRVGRGRSGRPAETRAAGIRGSRLRRGRPRVGRVRALRAARAGKASAHRRGATGEANPQGADSG